MGQNFNIFISREFRLRIAGRRFVIGGSETNKVQQPVPSTADSSSTADITVAVSVKFSDIIRLLTFEI